MGASQWPGTLVRRKGGWMPGQHRQALVRHWAGISRWPRWSRSMRSEAVQYLLYQVVSYQKSITHYAVLQLANASFGFFWLLLYHQPLNPHDTPKHHFCISQKRFNSLQRNPWKCNNNKNTFSSFATHFNVFKSLSSTTRRTLRQQFAACSGWRWK